MNSNGHPRVPVVSAIVVLVVSVFFFILVGKSSSSIWPYNAVHNWEQYGFTALHGKLVLNPGGFEALEHPDTYKGHRPAAYYPVLLTGKLLGWLGDSLLIYHALFSVALFFGVWFLLGRGPLALVGGFAAALCPGYAVYPSVVDPNAMALYMVVPYAAVLVNFLTAKELPPLRLIVQFLILGRHGRIHRAHLQRGEAAPALDHPRNARRGDGKTIRRVKFFGARPLGRFTVNCNLGIEAA